MRSHDIWPYVAAASIQKSIFTLDSDLYGDLGVGLEMAPLIKEFIAKLSLNFNFNFDW